MARRQTKRGKPAGPKPPARGSGSAGKKTRIKAVTIGSKAGSSGDAFTGRSKQKHNWRGRTGVGDLVEPPIDHQDLADLLLESTDFSSVCRQISYDVAGLGWDLQLTNFGEQAPRAQAEQEREVAEQFWEEAPGGEGDESLRAILQNAIMDQESTGDGYLELASEVVEVDGEDKERPTGLFHLQTTRTRIRKDKMGFAQLGRQQRDLVWFRSYGTELDTGLEWPTRQSDDDDEVTHLHQVIHLRHYHPASFWYGVSPIVPAIAAVRGNTFAADRNIKFFFNKALPELALIVEGETESLPDEEMQAFVDNLTDHFLVEMQGEHFKPLFLQMPNGITLRVEKLSPEMKDSDHNLYRKDNRDEILRAYSMMPNRVGVIESGNLGGGTGESQIEIYKNSVVKPRQEDLERKLTRIMRDGLNIRCWGIKFHEIDTVDEQREASIAGILGSLAWLTINEGRAYTSKFLKIDLPEIDEPWADLPFPVLAPQLALLPIDIPGILPVSEDDEGGEHTEGRKQFNDVAQYFVDQAYRRFWNRSRESLGKRGGRTLPGRPDAEAGRGKSATAKTNNKHR